MRAARRGQWPVVAVNAVVAVTVLAVVAVLAFVVKPAAPPGIAAFAPQATKPITKAPLGQSAELAKGVGQCAGQVCIGPSASPVATAPGLPTIAPSALPSGARGVPSALQCYAWPDGTVTQTFDPQSPPCIASWDDTEGNGGATSPGVTASEIRVALPVNSTVTPTGSWPVLKPLVDFFNTRYQFYGRKLRILPFVSQQANLQYTGTFNDPSAQRADASQITQMKVFATTDFIDPIHYSMSLPVFRGVLTKNKIISLAGGETTPYATAEGLEAQAPYEWSYYPTIDSLMGNVATMACRQLVGKPAKYAPDQAMRGTTRKFAVLIPTDDNIGGPLPGLPDLLRILEGCGVTSPRVVRYDYGATNRAPLAAGFRELADDGVTSVIFYPQGGSDTSHPMAVAGQVNYQPEWVLIGHNKFLTANALGKGGSQAEGAFGVAIWNKMPPLGSEVWAQAFLAAGGDSDVLNSGQVPNGRAFYQEMLLLAAGIQMAGPNLTPQAFAEGLASASFPNPGAGTAPSYQGTVGFRPGDMAMVSDYVGFWLDTRMTGPEVTNSKNLNTHRANCYVSLGRRHTLDTWPTTDGFYQGRCR